MSTLDATTRLDKPGIIRFFRKHWSYLKALVSGLYPISQCRYDMIEVHGARWMLTASLSNSVACKQCVSFFISKFKILNFVLPIEAFFWMFHVDFFSTNDEWRHHTRGVARNCCRLCLWMSLSVWSRWLPLYVAVFCLALYQRISLPPSLWCEFQSFHGLLGWICWFVCYPTCTITSFVISTNEVNVKRSD